MGVFILILGMIVAIMPKLLAQGVGDVRWFALYIASAIPSAVSSVLREVRPPPASSCRLPRD